MEDTINTNEIIKYDLNVELLSLHVKELLKEYGVIFYKLNFNSTEYIL